jgi:PAS domain S-box-containing protein
MRESFRQSQSTPGGDAAGQPVRLASAFCSVADSRPLESLISEISARVVKVSAEALDGEILRSLREVLLPLGVDRGGLLEVCEDSPVVKVSHAWYDEGVAQVSGEINLAELFPWSYQQLVVQGQTVAMASRDDLPPEADVDRQSHVLLGTRSALTIPLFIGQRVHHLVAVNAQKAERAWPAEVITHLRLLGEIFVSALQRRDADRALLRTMERLDLAAASADAGLWELDFETGLIWTTEKARQLFGLDAGLELTLARFLEEVHTEDRGMIRDAIDAAHRTGGEVSVEYRIPTPDGEVRWMSSRGRFQTGGASEPSRLMGVTLEVTRRKQMERQLQEQFQEIGRLKELLERENACLRNEVAICDEFRAFGGVSGNLGSIMTQVEQVARTCSTVLVQGETGTGKELIAQAIHRISERGKRPMVKVNCAALPAALVESELFGREKGAFTGALSRQMGRFELADGSTLFLDEIAEMPLETQAKLLRVLQDGEFERLGSPQTIKVDVRVIAATNRDLAEEVEKGRFRRDLYYRLNVFPIQVPPLRERPEDIPKLAWEFVNEFGERMGKKVRRIAAGDLQALVMYSWPGNIRELRNVIEHAMIVSQGETLELHRPAPLSQPGETPTTLEDVERRHIQAILKATHGRVKGAGGAAERLGLNPSTLYSRMRKLGINPVHP